MAVIVKATFIAQDGTTIIRMNKSYSRVVVPMQIVKCMLTDINKSAKLTNQFSYVKGSYTSDCSTKEWIAYLKERI